MKHNEKTVEIVYVPFPKGKIHGAVTECTDKYLIVIDSDCCKLQQYSALGHELAHVFLNHFDSNKPIIEAETEARARTWEFYRAYRNGTLPA